MAYLSQGSGTFYRYLELYQLRNKRTGQKIHNCASIYDCKQHLLRIKRQDWKLAKDLVIIKLDREEELKWTSN